MTTLTRRQLEVLEHATFTNKEIGRLLGISKETVKNHFTDLRERISAHAGHAILGRTSQLIYALQQGWYDLNDISCWKGQCSVEEEM